MRFFRPPSSLKPCFEDGGRAMQRSDARLRFEQLTVAGGLPGQRERISAGSRGHPPPLQGSAPGGQVEMTADRRNIRAGTGRGKDGRQLFAGLAARGHDAAAERHLREKRPDIGRHQDFQKSIRRIVFQAPDTYRRVEESQAMLLAECYNPLAVKHFSPPDRGLEAFCVSEMDQALDAPEVIDKVGVEEIHRPALARRRETAEKKRRRVRRQERLKRMVLDGHTG